MYYSASGDLLWPWKFYHLKTVSNCEKHQYGHTSSSGCFPHSYITCIVASSHRQKTGSKSNFKSILVEVSVDFPT